MRRRLLRRLLYRVRECFATRRRQNRRMVDMSIAAVESLAELNAAKQEIARLTIALDVAIEDETAAAANGRQLRGHLDVVEAQLEFYAAWELRERARLDAETSRLVSMKATYLSSGRDRDRAEES